MASDTFLELVSIHVADRQAQFLYASPSFHNIVGYPPKTLLGKSIFAFIHTEDVDRVRVALRGTLSLGECPEVIFRFKCRDATHTWLRLSSQLADEGRQFVLVACDLSLAVACTSLPTPFAGFKNTLAQQISMARNFRDTQGGSRTVDSPQNVVITLKEVPQDRLVISTIAGHESHSMVKTQEGMMGKDIWDLLFPDDQPLFEFLIRQLLRGAPAMQDNILSWNSSPGYIWCQVHLRQLHNSRGTLEMVCAHSNRAPVQDDPLLDFWDSVIDYYQEDLTQLEQAPAVKRQCVGTGTPVGVSASNYCSTKQHAPRTASTAQQQAAAVAQQQAAAAAAAAHHRAASAAQQQAAAAAAATAAQQQAASAAAARQQAAAASQQAAPKSTPAPASFQQPTSRYAAAPAAAPALSKASIKQDQ